MKMVSKIGNKVPVVQVNDDKNTLTKGLRL